MTKQEIADKIHATMDELNLLRIEAEKAHLKVTGLFCWDASAPLTVTIHEAPTPPKVVERSKLAGKK